MKELGVGMVLVVAMNPCEPSATETNVPGKTAAAKLGPAGP